MIKFNKLINRLFVDMDGVLADFDKGHELVFGKRPNYEADDVDWNLIRKHPSFFRDLPLMADAFVLWDSIAQFHPTVLTGVPSSIPQCAVQKREWVRAYLGSHVEVITCESKLKFAHGIPGDVLIDDRAKCGEPWIKMGGFWIKHTSAETSLDSLLSLMI